jgi:hypothetical protein
MKWLPPRSAARRGSVLIEFAMASLLLAALFTGAFQYGYAYYVYNNLHTAVSVAAKYAAAHPYESADGRPPAAYLEAVRNMAVYGDPSGGQRRPAAPGLTPEQVRLNVAFAKGAPKWVTVAISAYTIDAAFGKLSLSEKPAVTFPYHGAWMPPPR